MKTDEALKKVWDEETATLRTAVGASDWAQAQLAKGALAAVIKMAKELGYVPEIVPKQEKALVKNSKPRGRTKKT